MANIKCENGHYYDDKMFFRCPHCGIEFQFVTDKNNKTGKEIVQPSELQDRDKTELV